MKKIELTVDEELLGKACQYADEHDTTLEALLTEHMAVLADRAGRRLTVREQTYVDYRPLRTPSKCCVPKGYPRSGRLPSSVLGNGECAAHHPHPMRPAA